MSPPVVGESSLAPDVDDSLLMFGVHFSHDTECHDVSLVDLGLLLAGQQLVLQVEVVLRLDGLVNPLTLTSSRRLIKWWRLLTWRRVTW